MKESEEKGVKRYEMIAPLMQAGLGAADKRRRRAEIMERHSLSERTLRRYISAYKKQGFAGLRPKERKKGSRVLSAEIMEAAIKLRRELPERSVRSLITIMESDGIIKYGAVSSSTLSHNLKSMGATTSELRREIAIGPAAARRFVRIGRNTLWQSDIKYGPYILDGMGQKRRSYLACFLDDATRLITHGEFYENQRLPILEDSLRKALIKFGKPDEIYVDNGSQYTSRWFRLTCARLGIKYMNAKPYSPESKGKIERFNRTVEEFTLEIGLERSLTLAQLNARFKAWLDEGYQKRSHSGIGGESPMDCFRRDAKKIRSVTAEECYEAFMHEETRSVDKCGCLTYRGVMYEAGVELTGKKVDIRFDPFDLSLIEIWHRGKKIRMSSPLNIREFCGSPPAKGSCRTEPGNSALLDVYTKLHEKRNSASAYLLSFAAGGEETDV
jgi:transposase InsO family protein